MPLDDTLWARGKGPLASAPVLNPAHGHGLMFAHFPVSLQQKANSRLQVPAGDRTISRLSESAKAARDALICCMKVEGWHRRKFEHNALLGLYCRVTYRDWRRDLSIDLVCDALQLAGVIHNDRYIVAQMFTRAPHDVAEGVFVAVWQEGVK